MIKKRKLSEIVLSSQEVDSKSAEPRDGDGDATSYAFPVIGRDPVVVSRGCINAGEATTGSPHYGVSCHSPNINPQELTGDSREISVLNSGREAGGELGRLPREGRLYACPSRPLHDPSRNHDLLIIVPPSRHIGAQRLVSPQMFAQGLQEALFGPALLENEACNMWTSSAPSIPSFQYFIAGHGASAVAPPVRVVVVHIRFQYALYLTWYRAGLATLAHDEGNPGTTLDLFERNRGLIRSVVHRMLMNEEHELSGEVCRRCSEPADWTASCCSLTLCSYCLPREFLINHLTGNSCEALGKNISLQPMNSSRDIVSGVSSLVDGWLCTRQLLVQVEDEGRDRQTRQKDVFLFRSYALMEDILGLRPAKKKTILFHMHGTEWGPQTSYHYWPRRASIPVVDRNQWKQLAGDFGS